MMELPEPLHKITERPVQWPTVGGSNAPGSVPVHALPVLVHNNIQLANKPASPPPHPTIAQTLTALPLSLQFSFNQVTLPTGATNVISSYRVYRNTSANNFSGATLMRTFVHDPTRQGSITVQDNTGGGKTYYYFLTSVDTTGQESTAVGAQAGAIVSGNANANINQVDGPVTTQTTASTSFVDVPNMALTITTKGNPVLVIFTGSMGIDAASFSASFQLIRDGGQIGTSIVNTPQNTSGQSISLSAIDAVGAGSHTYKVQWKTGTAGHTVSLFVKYSMQIVELG